MCIFCKIANKEIPSYTIYEDDDVLAFLDISQVSKGHTLVIPKKHTDNFLTCEDDIRNKVFKVAQTIGNTMMDTLGCKGINILSNINEVAGQSVFHFHVHVIPRYSEDDACVIEFKASEEQDLEALQSILKGCNEID